MQTIVKEERRASDMKEIEKKSASEITSTIAHLSLSLSLSLSLCGT